MEPERTIIVRVLPWELDMLTVWASLEGVSISDLVRRNLDLPPVEEVRLRPPVEPHFLRPSPRPSQR